MYKITNDIVYKNTGGINKFYCNKNETINGIKYEFCMGQCGLDNCNGCYHQYTISLNDTKTYLCGTNEYLSVEEAKAIKTEEINYESVVMKIRELKDKKAMWFDFDGNFQRFEADDIDHMLLGREALLPDQPLVDLKTGLPLMEDDGVTRKIGQHLPSILWNYPEIGEGGEPIRGKHIRVIVTSPDYFTAMMLRGGVHKQVCFDAEDETMKDLDVFVGDVKDFDYETVFNNHYNTLIAPYL